MQELDLFFYAFAQMLRVINAACPHVIGVVLVSVLLCVLVSR